MNSELKLITVGLSLSLLACACTSEKDRVFAEAKKCAATITRGGKCLESQSNRTSEQPTPPPAASPDPSRKESLDQSNESRVYVDATQSMRGFASSRDTVFSKLVEELSYAMPGARLYKYGISSGGNTTADTNEFAQEIRFSQELRKPSFYDRGYNQDEVLFNYLASEQHPARSVLVTDGVYSAPQSQLQSEVVMAIAKWLEHGRFFGILIFTSPFKGSLYSENSRAWIPDVDESARPFYAFVFSPDEKGFRDLKEKLAVDFNGMESLEFSRDAVSCFFNPNLKPGLERKDMPPASPFYLHMYNARVFDGNSAEFAYDFQCRLAHNYPVAEFGLDVSLDSYSWNGSTFRRSLVQPKADFVYESQIPEPQSTMNPPPSPAAVSSPGTTPSPAAASKRRPALKLRFQKNFEADYMFHHVIFRLSNKAVLPSVRALSTEDDSQRTHAERTYRFFEFISSLASAHLQSGAAARMPPPFFVTLENK